MFQPRLIEGHPIVAHHASLVQAVVLLFHFVFFPVTNVESSTKQMILNDTTTSPLELAAFNQCAF